VKPTFIKIQRLLAYSNLWVALSVAALTWLSGFLLESQNWSYILFTFFSTLGFYSYSRFYSGATLSKNESKVTRWQNNKSWVLVCIIFISTAISVYLALSFSTEAIVMLAVAAFISLIYPLPYILGRWPGIRHIAGLKLFIIALVWTTVTFVVPAIHTEWNHQTWILAVQRFFIITAITIPFDVRDQKIDHPDIATLPMVIGSKKALLAAVLMILGVELSILIQYFLHHYYTGLITFGLIIGLEIMMVLIHKSYPVKNDLHYSFWLEGTPIYLALLVYLFHLF
jgi:4-hydroxybenzoate polyprenyltransferase